MRFQLCLVVGCMLAVACKGSDDLFGRNEDVEFVAGRGEGALAQSFAHDLLVEAKPVDALPETESCDGKQC